MNDETTNLVIVGCPTKMRNLFVAICDDYLMIDRASAFAAMFRPYAAMVIDELSNHPNCDTEIIDALQYEIDEIFDFKQLHTKGGRRKA